MIPHLDRKLFRDLSRMKGQAAAVSLVMACGLAMLIMARSLITSLETTRADYYQSNRFADLFVALKRAPNHLGERLAALPGVAGVETDISVPVTLDLPAVEEPASGLVRSLPDFGSPELNRLFLRRGRWLAPGAQREVLVGEAFANANHLEPGQSLTILINGHRQSYQIAGIVLSPEYIFESRPGSALPDSRSYGIFWMPYKEVSTAFDLYGAFNHASFALAPGAKPEELISQIDELLRPYGGRGAFARKDHPSHIRVSDEIRVLEILAIGFPLIFLTVAAVMTNAVLSRLLNLQREQIAILKAFGFSNREIVTHYLKFGGILVGLGTLFGTLGGILLGMRLVRMYTLYFRFPDLHFHLDQGAILIALLVGLLAITVGVLGSVRRAARLPPAEAMRPEAPANYRNAFVERLGGGPWLGHATRMALRNIERRPMQAFFTMAGLALGSALLIIPNTFQRGIDHIMDFKWDVVQREDVMLMLNEPGEARIVHEFEALPGVLSVEPTRYATIRIAFAGRNRQILLRSLVEGGLHDRAIDADLHEVPPPTEGIALSQKLGEVLGVHVGDQVVIEALEGRRPTKTFTVCAFIEDLSGIAGYMEIHAVNRFLGEGDVITGSSVRIDTAQRSAFLAALKGIPKVSGIVVKNTMRQSFRETTAQSMGLLQKIYLIFAIVVTTGVIYNNARISLAERSREFATLRVVGMTLSEVGSVLVVELVILAAVALPAGLLLGSGFAAVIIHSVNTETVRLPLVLTTSTYSFAALVVLGASAASAFVVLRKLRHLDLIAALKAPE